MRMFIYWRLASAYDGAYIKEVLRSSTVLPTNVLRMKRFIVVPRTRVYGPRVGCKSCRRHLWGAINLTRCSISGWELGRRERSVWFTTSVVLKLLFSAMQATWTNGGHKSWMNAKTCPLCNWSFSVISFNGVWRRRYALSISFRSAKPRDRFWIRAGHNI